MGLRMILGNVAVSLLVVLGYHLVTRPDADSPPDRAEMDRMETRVRDLEVAATSARAREERLRRRVADAEARAAGGGLPPPDARAEPDPTWTADEREAEAQAFQRRLQDLAAAKARIRQFDPSNRLSEAEVDRAAALLADHAQAIRALYEGPADVTAEEIASRRARFEQMRDALQRALAPLVPAEMIPHLAGTAEIGSTEAPLR